MSNALNIEYNSNYLYSKPQKKETKQKQAKKDENLKYIYKFFKTYYYIRRVNYKLHKINLRTNDIIEAIRLKNMIDNKMNPNYSITLDLNGNFEIKKDANDTDEDILNLIKKINHNKAPTYQNIENLITDFFNYKSKIEKVKESYIIELNASFKYLKFFLHEYKIENTQQLNTSFFASIFKDFFYIPKRFFTSKYKSYSLANLKRINLDDNEKFNNKTINKHFIFYNEFIKYLIREGIFKENPIKIKYLKEEDGGKEPFTNDELNTIFNKVKNQEALNYFYFLMYSGLRNQELSKLKICHIKNNVICLEYSKSINGIRTIPLHPCLKNIVKQQSQNKKSDDFLFFNGKFGSNDKRLNALLKKAGLNKTLHSLRKNFSVKLFENTDNMLYIKYLIGHSLKSEITFTTYNREKINIEQLAEIINKINYDIKINFKFSNDINIF